MSGLTTEALMQALTDPENQPSQWGTVPLSMLQAAEARIADLAARCERLEADLAAEVAENGRLLQQREEWRKLASKRFGRVMRLRADTARGLLSGGEEGDAPRLD